RAVVNNRRRGKRDKSKKLQRRRGEGGERTFAHICDTGGARRGWLRRVGNVTKRYLVAGGAHHLGPLLRLLNGIGKPKSLQGEGVLAALAQLLMARLTSIGGCLSDTIARSADPLPQHHSIQHSWLAL